MSGYSGLSTGGYNYEPEGGFEGTFGTPGFKYNTGKADPKKSSSNKDAAQLFLDAFTKGMGYTSKKDKYRDSLTGPSFLGSSSDGNQIGFSGGMGGDLTFVAPPKPSFGGITIPGQEGEEGWGSKLGRVALGAGAGALTGMTGGTVGGGWLGAGGGLLGGLSGIV